MFLYMNITKLSFIIRYIQYWFFIFQDKFVILFKIANGNKITNVLKKTYKF